MTKPKRKLAAGQMTVAQAAKLLGITTSGVYAAIKKGAIVAKRTRDGIAVARDSAKEYRAAQIKFMRESSRPKDRPLTDEEYLQRMWDNDPD